MLRALRTLSACRRAACAIALLAGACGDDTPKETHFKAFTSEAAARRSAEFSFCIAGKNMDNKWDREALVTCMERKGYGYQPR